MKILNNNSQVGIDPLPSADWNSFVAGLTNIITASGESTSPSAGDLQMIQSIARHVSYGAVGYTDGGSPNNYILASVGDFRTPSLLLDGMIVFFKPSNTNTGPSKVTVGGLGTKDILFANGTVLVGGELDTDDHVQLQYSISLGAFLYQGGTYKYRADSSNPSDYPVGGVINWPNASIPAGWLLCDGSAVSRATYVNLFNAIGVNFGSGDGSTTFNLPDLRSRVGVGVDPGNQELDFAGADELGTEYGSPQHTLTASESIGHFHVVPWTIGYSDGSAAYVTNSDWADSGGYGNITAESGGGNPHENQQPYLLLNYIIKE